MEFYYKYSDYLKRKYKEKVYKLPVNLPVTCPNRLGGESGCAFCSEVGTGFEAMSSFHSVQEQLLATKEHIEKKYKAKKYIAYFQNFTNTFLSLERFREYVQEAVRVDDIVEIAVSTRPDCVSEAYMQVLEDVRKRYGVEITVEMGLQTVNYHTLDFINRGHGLAEFIDAVRTIQSYGFSICVHIILNLPCDTLRDCIETAKVISAMQIDTVKLHSLYIAKNTLLCEYYENGTITICSKEEYLRRVETFLEYLDPGIAVERLFSRIPQKDAVFCNWNTSWWKLQDELLENMRQDHSYQGKRFHYLRGAALKKLGQEETH